MEDTRLAISLLDPSGSVAARWGPDADAVGDVPKGLVFTTSDPGGFRDANLALARRIDRDWPDLKLLRDIRIYGAGNRTAWEGRLQELPRHSGSEHSINPEAVGHITEMDDAPDFAEIYVGRDLGEWTELSAQWRIGWGSTYSYRGFSIGPDAGEGRPSVILELDGSWGAGQLPVAAAMYDAGSGLKIATLDYDWAVTNSFASFILELYTGDDDVPKGGKGLGDLATGAASGSGELSPAKQVMAWQWSYAGAAGEAGAQYRATLRRLAWFGSHGLPIRGERPNRGIYGSDVIANIVRRTAPRLRFTTGPEGTIRDSEYPIPHLVFKGATKGSDAVLATNAYHQRFFGVYDDRTFFWLPTNTYRKRWRIRRSKGHGVDLLGQQAEDAMNGLIVNYTGFDGVSRTVGPPGCTIAYATSELLADTSPGNPVNAAGIEKKYGELNLGFRTDATGAIQVGYAYFQMKLQSASSRGSVTVTGMVEDDATGALYPPWFMRAGDSAIVTDGDNIERRIIGTRYENDTETNVCDLDSTPRRVDAEMARMGLSLVGAGD